jgi:putative transposase
VLSEFTDADPRNDAIALAYLSGQHTMAAIAQHFGVHYTTVSGLVKVFEQSQKDAMR